MYQFHRTAWYFIFMTYGYTMENWQKITIPFPAYNSWVQIWQIIYYISHSCWIHVLYCDSECSLMHFQKWHKSWVKFLLDKSLTKKTHKTLVSTKYLLVYILCMQTWMFAFIFPGKHFISGTEGGLGAICSA